MASEAIVAVTYLCNARCNMCNLWQTTEKPTLTADDLRKLPSTLRHINVTGGEPFLRTDLADLVAAMKETAPRAQIVITTNGFQPQRTEEIMRDILRHDPTAEVGVSIDGLKAQHEEIRGIPKGFEKSFETIRRLQSIGVRRVVVAHTMQEANLSSSYALYQLARRQGLDFGCVVTENSEVHFQKTNNACAASDRLREELEKITRAELRSWSPKRWFRGLFSHGLFRRAAGHGRSIPCTAGNRFFFLDPWGQVFPCNVLNIPLGNIKENLFSEIWTGETMQKTRSEIAGCEKCFMSCSVYPEVRRNPLRYAWSAAGLKLKAHLGLPLMHPTSPAPEAPVHVSPIVVSEDEQVPEPRSEADGFPTLHFGENKVPTASSGTPSSGKGLDE